MPSIDITFCQSAHVEVSCNIIPEFKDAQYACIYMRDLSHHAVEMKYWRTGNYR